MKPLIELSFEHYDALLKGAAENSPLYSRLTNAVKTQKTIVIPCELDEAEILLHITKSFCPDAVPEIEKVIRSAQFPG